MHEKNVDRRSPIIWGAVVLTAALLGLFALLLAAGKRPSECLEGWWLLDRLSCLEPNALGDTFAGAFAPVAFVWLVAAVLLQRNELAAQRQELREAREVAVQQVEEARKNVQLISVQTSILEEDRKAKVEHEADQDILELARTAISVYKGAAAQFSINWNPNDAKSVDVYPLHSSHVFEPTLDGLGDISERIHSFDADMQVGHFEKEPKFSYGGEYHFDRLLKIFQLFDLTAAKTSTPMKAELARLGLDNLEEILSSLLEHVKEYGEDSIPF